MLTVARPISCSSLKVALLIACLCSHNHLTSIRFNFGDLTGKNTNFILGQSLDRRSFTFFDLCTDRLSRTRKIFLIVLSYLLSNLFKKSTNCFLFSFDSNVYSFCHLYGHMLQTHLTIRLFFEPSQPLPVLMTMIYHHKSLQLSVLSHLDIEEWNSLAYNISVVQCTFFQSVFWVIAFEQDCFRFSPFYIMF